MSSHISPVSCKYWRQTVAHNKYSGEPENKEVELQSVEVSVWLPGIPCICAEWSV